MNFASRRQMIQGLTAPRTGITEETAISLWRQVAAQVTSIVGDGGFESLYDRSVFLTQARFPWLSDLTDSAPTEQRFERLQTHLEEQTPATAADANALLLTTLTDLLASLIGEPLTARILESAWGGDARDKDNEEPEHD